MTPARSASCPARSACAPHVLFFAGELAAAASLVEEVQVAAEATGTEARAYGALGLAAFRGREAETAALASAAKQEVAVRGEGNGIGIADWGDRTAPQRSRPPRPCAGRRRTSQRLPRGGEHSELGSGRADRGGRPRRVARTRDRGDAAARGVHQGQRHRLGARGGGAVTRPAERRRGRRAACTGRRSSGSAGPGCARSWPARICCTGNGCAARIAAIDAREQLRAAYQMLTAMGMDGFAERARRELLATGETVRKRTVETLTDLTAQEAQIARLARDGHTNQEIAVQLFISPHTVEWHLGNVFTKLGITSRKELR